ncbi:MAG TPA: hypothetical protein VGF14_04685 [Alphaproteobacteria bacterium]
MVRFEGLNPDRRCAYRFKPLFPALTVKLLTIYNQTKTRYLCARKPMNQNFPAPLSNSSAIKRFFVLAVLVCFLTAQVFAGWHSTQHAVHEKIHCNVCASVSQLDNAVPVITAKASVPLDVMAVIYHVKPQTGHHIVFAAAYDAQGPPSA